MSDHKHLYRVWLASDDRESCAEVLLNIPNPEWAAEDGLEQILWDRVHTDLYQKAFDSPLVVVVESDLGGLKRFSVTTRAAFACTAEEVTE